MLLYVYCTSTIDLFMVSSTYYIISIITALTTKQVKVGSEEEKFAKDALFTRHPAMEDWDAPGR